MVFYRKYRPQIIADLDNAIVREKLVAALLSENVPHAFLFTGPKGLGKTSTARIVAKAVNCEKSAKLKTRNEKNIEPCNTCHQCISITNGTNLDVLEIDGASNRGIDEIRDLQDKINLAPFSAKKKVYIIDEVHMLTTEAFNALLKTLEEPPSHALFILCTTESHKVPATIVSRCFQIAFSRATTEELVRSFKRIIQGEGQLADEEALREIAKLSDGSFRDGAKALEEMVGLAKGEKITKELVEEKYQVTSIKHQVSGLLKVLDQKDTKAGLQLVGKVVEQGIDIKYFVEQVINLLHALLLQKIGIESKESIGELSFSIEEIKDLVELLSKAHGEIKYAVLPQLPLELVVVEWGAGGEGASRLPHSERDARSGASQNQVQSRSLNESRHQNIVVKNENKDTSTFSSLSGEQPTSSSGSKEKIDDREFWFAFLDTVKKESHTIAGVLRGCHMVRYDDTELVVETRHTFHKEKLEERIAKELLEKACKELTGKDIRVSILLQEK